jgi:sensor histidine kinase YesM
MENVTISKGTLETLLETALQMYEYDGLDLTIESDRKIAIMVQEAIEAIDGFQEQLEEKRRIEAEAEQKRWKAKQEAKAIEDQKAAAEEAAK